MPIHLQTPDRLVIYVSDMERSTAFYRHTLGLPLRFASPGWTEFNNGGTTLALHRHLQEGGETKPAQSEAGRASLIFVVDDLQSTYETLKAEGANFSLPPQKQPAGRTFAILHDPDGFAVTLQQREG